ncbi:MAG: ABC transporter permease [Methylobacteriaceae bacterium]|nr:ABC transporter permease [Methylobacteriaceae bacterium]
MTDAAQEAPAKPRTNSILSEPAIVVPAIVLLFLVFVAIAAPWLGTIDPTLLDPAQRNKLPGFVGTVTLPDGSREPFTFLMGTDNLGRDIYSRVVYGSRISLIVGALVAIVSTALGLAIGMVAGYVRWSDGLIMRLMDGLMAIPPILLAIALVSLSRAGVTAVVIAIAIPEIPRVVRLVRSIVLSIREEPYVEAAVTAGTPTPTLLVRHILPNCVAPLIVQATFVAASAILVESILSFLGVGIPPEIPSWGNIMAAGREYFRIFPQNILYPGICITVTILCVNILGDAMRDRLDPKLRKRV